MKVFGWSAGNDGCRYYRMQLPLVQLRKTYGWETYYAEKWEDEYPFAGGGWREPDVLIGQRVSTDGASSLWQKISKRTRFQRPFMVYELDDDFTNIETTNPAYKFFSEHEHNVLANIAAADRVTVSTDALAEVVQKYNADVVVVPNYIPAALVDGVGSRLAGPRGTVTIGWGGSFTHHMDWAQLDKHLYRYMQKTEFDVELHTMGYPYAEGWKGVSVRHTNWFPTTPAYLAAVDFDIGLAPLRPSPFNRSKSYIKALEYAALGIPAVTSDVGPYSGFVRHGETGFLIKQDWMWGRYLRELVDCTDLRVVMGDAAREYARGFVIEAEANIGRWKKALSPS